jgi:hypothetical protein
METYKISIDVRDSRNFKSLGLGVEYGSTNLPNETSKQLQNRVESEAIIRLNRLLDELSDFKEDLFTT